MYKAIIRPLLFHFEPEKAHRITFQLLKALQSTPGALPLVKWIMHNQSEPVHLMGLSFPNRVGLAAGLDKNAELLKVWQALGFGFAEIGTVTPHAQPGNPKPRLFRIPQDQALINRMGFNNQGVDAVVHRLKKRPKGYIVGGNIGKNTLTPNELAKDDYLRAFNRLSMWVDYIVVNVSCPNISNLSKLQDRDSLRLLLQAIMSGRENQSKKNPVLLKISPDLNDSQLADTLNLVSEMNLDGIIATNTSNQRKGLHISDHKIQAMGNGGLSGKPLSDRTTDIIRIIRREMGSDIPVIASGGIVNTDDARAKLDAGADMLQLYTGFIYSGTRLIKQCLQL
ncbi:MAG: quinone-dependent dihydroorotate dehydrogenase [Salinivirgaceae bacterium]